MVARELATGSPAVMLVRVRLFAIARERAGRPTIDVEITDAATIADLKMQIAALVPSLSSLLPAIRFSVDGVYAEDATPIPPGSDLAAIPPVSGGTATGMGR